MSLQKVKVGDRWAIIGASGTGKTVLSRSVLNFYHGATQGRVPIGIIDSKISGDFDMYERRKDLTAVVRGDDPEKAAKTLLSGKHAFMIWRPDEDDRAMYNEYFRRIYLSARNKNTVSINYLDELSSVTDQGGKPPRYYDILLKQGRGMNNGMISVTQSPSFIPPSLIRQATHVIRFNVNDDYDCKKLVRAMGPDVLTPPAHQYGFWYRNCLRPAAVAPAQYYADFRDFI